MQYSFGSILQMQLDQFVREWNCHRIRQSNMAELPNGVPEVLYNFPTLHGSSLQSTHYYHASCIAFIIGVEDYKRTVSNRHIYQAKQLFSEEPIMVCQYFKETADEILRVLRKDVPTNFNEALEVFFILSLLFD